MAPLVVDVVLAEVVAFVELATVVVVECTVVTPTAPVVDVVARVVCEARGAVDWPLISDWTAAEKVPVMPVRLSGMKKNDQRTYSKL